MGVDCLCYFFFSSRRRHTRFKCDWSSDVCSSDLKILPDGLEIPQRSVNGVVFRLAVYPDGGGAGVGEIVRQHSPVNVSRKGKKDLPGNSGAAGRERQSRQRNHGVAPPVSKPVIAGDDAAAIGFFGQAALYDELICSEDQLPNPPGYLPAKTFVFLLPVVQQLHILIGALRTGRFLIE